MARSNEPRSVSRPCVGRSPWRTVTRGALALALLASTAGGAPPNDVASLLQAKVGAGARYAGTGFGDETCDRTFGRTGTVAAKDAEAFRACLGKLLLRAADPFRLRAGGASSSYAFWRLESATEMARLDVVHADRGPHSRKVPIAEEKIVEVTVYRPDAVRAHILRALPAGIERLAPAAEALAQLRASGREAIDVVVDVCVGTGGSMSMCSMRGNSGIPAFDHQVNEAVCMLERVGRFQPDGVPIEACADIHVSWRRK